MKGILLDASSAILLAKTEFHGIMAASYSILMSDSVFDEITRKELPGSDEYKELLQDKRLRVLPVSGLSTADTHLQKQDKSHYYSTAAEAQKYVSDLTLGGYTDWRLPTKAESHNLFFSLDFGESDAKKLGMKMGGAIWIQMENEEIIAGEWDAGETCCIIRTLKKNSRGKVRAVRP